MNGARQNLTSFSLALLLHVTIVGSFFLSVDLSEIARTPAPLSIKATLVTDAAVALPPPVEPAEAPPQPVPTEQDVVEPAVVEPTVVEPDLSEQARIAAEEEKRRQDALIEQRRLEEIRRREAEEKRKAEEKARQEREEQARRQREEEARRQREAEAEKERQRLEAERRRQEDIERQRAENERLHREAEAAARQAEIDAEDRRLAAIRSGATEAYMFAIQQKVVRNWVPPASARPGLECDVRVRQLQSGEVVSVNIVRCNGDAAVQRSIEAAVFKASPLPQPSDPSIFERNLMLVFKPEE